MITFGFCLFTCLFVCLCNLLLFAICCLLFSSCVHVEVRTECVVWWWMPLIVVGWFTQDCHNHLKWHLNFNTDEQKTNTLAKKSAWQRQNKRGSIRYLPYDYTIAWLSRSMDEGWFFHLRISCCNQLNWIMPRLSVILLSSGEDVFSRLFLIECILFSWNYTYDSIQFDSHSRHIHNDQKPVFNPFSLLLTQIPIIYLNSIWIIMPQINAVN